MTTPTPSTQFSPLGANCRIFKKEDMVKNLDDGEMMLGAWFPQFQQIHKNDVPFLSGPKKCPVVLIEEWDISSLENVNEAFDITKYLGFTMKMQYKPKIMAIKNKGWIEKGTNELSVWNTMMRPMADEPKIVPSSVRDIQFKNSQILNTDGKNWAIIYFCQDKGIDLGNVFMRKGENIQVWTRQKAISEMKGADKKALVTSFNKLFKDQPANKGKDFD
jgi:hypothetical protein